MKKILILLITVICGMCIQVSAKESYYKNDNNVSFTKEQYEYFTAMFYDGYQELITQEEFNTYNEDEMKAEYVETKYLDFISPLSTLHETAAKQLKISKSTISPIAKISVVLTWKGTPKVKSYDVMGTYLEGVNLVGNVITKVSYSGGNYDSNEIKNFNNGFGVSIKLPSSGSNIIVSQSFNATLGGTVYASYQHATSSISLASSKYYTISKSGYGKVFSFYNNMSSKYDGMGGVYIDV